MIRMQRLMTLVAVLALAGCASTQRTSFPPPEGPASPQTPRPDRPQPPSTGRPGPQKPATMPPRTAAEASSPAVMSLMGTADALARNGNMDRAAATLERALTLEPRNPFIYQRLASVKLAEGATGQAENMARKSNSVAGSNPFVRASNWQLIAEARRTGGDRSGASEATARASDYRSASQQLMQ